MNDSITRLRSEISPGGTSVRELAHAIAGALTLPNEVVTLAEPAYLRISRNHARVVLFGMRRIIADRDLDDAGLMAIVNTIREHTGQLGGDAELGSADPFRDFIGAIITALTISPAPPTAEKAYLQAARQRARRVLLACRRAVQGVCIEDHDLAAAIEMLGRSSGEDQAGGDVESGRSPEMIS